MEGLGGIAAFLVGWFVSQTIKIFTEWASRGKISGKEAFALLVKSRSGGMPSGHTASFVALTTYIGCSQGFGSMIFALSACVVMIVVYDAVNVRRSVGEIGQELKKEGKIDRVVRGHTMIEVIVGGVVGALIGWGVWMVLSQTCVF
jgi:hypothetical protein